MKGELKADWNSFLQFETAQSHTCSLFWENAADLRILFQLFWYPVSLDSSRKNVARLNRLNRVYITGNLE